ncbi:adenosylcobyric acid synthase [Aerococcaceae bacterium zg-ZJ1578]|uniref:type 1 glutamine amidotransferase n=1 Tax=Aerococcaceae bacterium zg-252 TaxID=2796928 RepID=UPI001A1EF999|nr:adenosylcobyric acid synthase [Aerococcaceae bacterium zg-1578]MBR7927597.1 adenosylcobyric acid synthase [Aerococcaceae bacterium zg-ZUI334]
MTKTLRICHLYGNLLNTYGDNGNLLMIQYYAREKGYHVETTMVSLDDSFNADDFDIVFFGGGQDFEQKIIAQDCQRLIPELTRYIESDGVLLSICGGFQMLGQYYTTADGEQIKGLGILPHYTERQINSRFIGDIEIYDEVNQQTYYGFENHNGVTHLTDQLQPLGRVLKGNGNNGVDKTEGVHYKNTFGSYFHGPLLVRNEWLARHIVDLAIQQKEKQ